MIRTNLRVEMAIKAIEGPELAVTEVAFVPLAVPRCLLGGVLDAGRTNSVSENGRERNSVVGIFRTHQTVHQVWGHIGQPGARAALDVMGDCSHVDG